MKLFSAEQKGSKLGYKLNIIRESTHFPSSRGRVMPTKTKRVCFVISPMGPNRSPMRKRRDYVLETYINPACERAGYEPLQVQGIGRDIVRGTSPSCSC